MENMQSPWIEKKEKKRIFGHFIKVQFEENCL
jgi:hypothetical protein